MPTINASSSSSSSSPHRRKEQSATSCSAGVSTYPNDISDDLDATVSNDIDDDANDDRWRIYKANPQAKPIYSYSQLILLALKRSGHEKMTLQMIYDWVADNFPYFKKMEPTWQVR
jgi:hypothetical protein